jgi:putative glutamine amidotransferase
MRSHWRPKRLRGPGGVSDSGGLLGSLSIRPARYRRPQGGRYASPVPPLIGITAIPRSVQTMYGPAAAHTCTDALTSSVAAAGGVPVLLPVVPADHAAIQLRGLDGLVLAGGQDVDPTSYGRPAAADGAWVHRGRDEHELALLAAARAGGLPVLGICRGLQLANVALGGDLIEHVDGHDAGARFALDLHRVSVEGGTLLERAIGGGELAVNSLHHQVVGALADGLRASATAPDGLHEAAEALDGPWFVAVQWHPELMGAVRGGQDLFAALVRESTA